MVQPVSDLRSFIRDVSNARVAYRANPSSPEAIREARQKCSEVFQRFHYLQLSPLEARLAEQAALLQFNTLLRELGSNLRISIKVYSGNTDFLAIQRSELVKEVQGFQQRMPVREVLRQVPAEWMPFDVDYVPFIAAAVVSIIALCTLGYLAMAIAGALTYPLVESFVPTIRESLVIEEMAEVEIFPTHELVINELAPRRPALVSPRLESGQHVCPISREVIPEQFLMFHEKTEQYFDYRHFFYFLISNGRKRQGYNGPLCHVDPLTQTKIERDAFTLVIDRYGINERQFAVLWGNEGNDKEAQVQAMAREEAQKRGKAQLSIEEGLAFLTDYETTEPLAMSRASDARVMRFLSCIKAKYQYTHFDHLASLRAILPTGTPDKPGIQSKFDQLR